MNIASGARRVMIVALRDAPPRQLSALESGSFGPESCSYRRDQLMALDRKGLGG
jgi:hypothetical protein